MQIQQAEQQREVQAPAGEATMQVQQAELQREVQGTSWEGSNASSASRTAKRGARHKLEKQQCKFSRLNCKERCRAQAVSLSVLIRAYFS
jgi:hypothetical protein